MPEDSSASKRLVLERGSLARKISVPRSEWNRIRVGMQFHLNKNYLQTLDSIEVSLGLSSGIKGKLDLAAPMYIGYSVSNHTSTSGGTTGYVSMSGGKISLIRSGDRVDHLGIHGTTTTARTVIPALTSSNQLSFAGHTSVFFDVFESPTPGTYSATVATCTSTTGSYHALSKSTFLQSMALDDSSAVASANIGYFYSTVGGLQTGSYILDEATHGELTHIHVSSNLPDVPVHIASLAYGVFSQ